MTTRDRHFAVGGGVKPKTTSSVANFVFLTVIFFGFFALLLQLHIL